MIINQFCTVLRTKLLTIITLPMSGLTNFERRENIVEM